MIKDSIGVITGRFQGLHLGHMEYLLAGKARCEYLIIGITNYLCNEKDDRISKMDSHRLNKNANPFTYFERMEMIRLAMLENKISESEFTIVPFPIEHPNLISNFAPKDATYYITIYDNWGKEKLKMLKDLGLNVQVMWERSLEEKPISGGLVRKKISLGEDSEHLVPKSIANYIKFHGLENAIKKSIEDN